MTQQFQSPFQSPFGRGSGNVDLQQLLDDAKRRRTERQAREEAVSRLNALPDISLNQFERERSARAVLEATNVEPQQGKSFLDRVFTILDLPAKHVSRPAMGTVLANVFRALPGEQAGEVALREAGAGNPFNLLFPDRRQEVRDALKETDLPFGAYTAMEIALDPLTYVPFGAAYKVAKGGRAALGLRAPAGKAAAQRIGRLTPLADRVDQVMTDNQMRRVGERLTHVPVVRSLVGVVNPSAATKSDVGRSIIGYQQLLEDSEGLVSIAVSGLAGRRFPFQILKKGDDAGKVILADGQKVAWGDLFQAAPGKYKLSDDQAGFIKNYSDVIEQARGYLDELKIPVRDIELAPGESFIPRIVLGKDNVDKFRAGLATSRAVGAKQSFQKPRYYQTMQEGLDAGIDYVNDPLALLTQHLRGVYRTVADEELLKALRPLGQTAGQRISQELRIKTATALTKRATLKRTEDILQRGRRGEKLPAGVIASVRRSDPQMGEALEAALKLPAKQKRDELARLIERTKGLAEQAEEPARLARAEMAQAREMARTLKVGSEARIPQPGLAGRIFPREVADEVNAMFTDRANGFIKNMATVNASARLGLTGFDFGAGMIQGLPLLVINPVAWTRAQGNALKALFDPHAFARYADTHQASLQEMAQHGGPVNMNEFVESIATGGGIERLLQKGGKITAPIRAATRRAAAAFTTLGVAARVELYESMKPMALRAGKAKGMADDKILEQLTETVGKMTGISGKARLGINASQSEVERALLFAPRYLRASLGLVADTAQGGLRGQLARQSMAKMLAGGLLMYYGWSAAMGQEPKLDPSRSDFLTVDIKGQRVGFGSIWVSMARTTAGIYGQVERQIKDEQYTGEQIVSIDPEKSILARFTRFRASPIAGLGWDIVRGRNPIGAPVGNPIEQPLEFTKDLPRYFMPFWAQQFIEDDSPIEGDEQHAVSFPAEIAGFRAFPTNIFTQRRTRRDLLARAAFQNSWEDLTGMERKAINERDEMLKAFDAQIRVWQLERGDDLDKLTAQFFEKQDEFREGYNKKVKMASGLWSDGASSGREWRERVLNAGREQRTLFSEINGSSSLFDPVVQELKNLRGDRSQEAIEDIAYDEYIQRVVIGAPEGTPEEGAVEISNVFGEMDFDERDRRIKEIRTKYGDAVFEQILIRFRIGRENDPLLNEWHEGLELFRNYWEIGDDLAREAGIFDQYKRFRSIQGSAEGDLLAEQFPTLPTIRKQQTAIRQQMRKGSPSLEAFLLKYGYISTIRNKTVEGITQGVVEKADFDPLSLPLQ